MKLRDSQPAADYIMRAADLYGIIVVESQPPQKGYRNQSFPLRLSDGTMVNLILYKNEPGIVEKIKNANLVAKVAAASNLPVRRTIDRRIVRFHAKKDTSNVRYGALYYYLSGETIAWEAYTQKHVKLLGAALSNLHAALHDFPADNFGGLPSVTKEYAAILAHMRYYFAEPGVMTAMRDKLGLAVSGEHLATLQQFVIACGHLPEQQALHMDFVRGNILFQPKPELHISGILDFEKTARGHRAFDIARTLAFLLVDCKYKTLGQIRKYFIDSGYNKHGKSSFQKTRITIDQKQYDLLEILIDMFLMHDFYKFLRHNPYESLKQNEHFARTRVLLVERGQLIAVVISASDNRIA